jgi:hypothetical protein
MLLKLNGFIRDFRWAAGSWLIFGATGLLAARGDAADQLPAGHAVDRYQQIWHRNPFTLVTPATPQATPSVFDKLVLVSWLKDGGKDVIFVQNTETNEVQKITTDPNKDAFRLLEMHPSQNQKLVEAVISNGTEQGSVKFHFEAPTTASAAAAGAQPPGSIAPPGVAPLQRPGFGNAPQLPQNIPGVNARSPFPQSAPGQQPFPQAQQAPNFMNAQPGMLQDGVPQQTAPQAMISPGLPKSSVPNQPEVRRKRLPPPNQTQQR